MRGGQRLDVDLQQPPVAQERDLGAAQARELLVDLSSLQVAGEVPAGLVLADRAAAVEPATGAVVRLAVGLVDDPEVGLAERGATRRAEVRDLVVGDARPGTSSCSQRRPLESSPSMEVWKRHSNGGPGLGSVYSVFTPELRRVVERALQLADGPVETTHLAAALDS
ncbi:MAG: hypothetical protein M3065_21170 [Actinomycetota bacterium]|nr:hypothetical protein [Actinomycetota bacterium]